MTEAILDLLDPREDFVFKAIFGTDEQKPLLISFLNSLLKGNPPIKDVSLKNTDITKILEKDKSSRLDIKAITDDKTIINIEIQIKNTGVIPERALFYTANLVPGSLEKGDSYKGYRVIGIWILGENVTSMPDAINEGRMTFIPPPDGIRKTYVEMTDAMRIINIELPKFIPENADTQDMLTRWLSFIKNPTLMDKTFLENKEVHDAMDRLQYLSNDEEMRGLAKLRKDALSDYNSGVTLAEKKGRAEGELNAKRETARNLLAMGLSTAQIASATGLSITEVESLRVKH